MFDKNMFDVLKETPYNILEWSYQKSTPRRRATIGLKWYDFPDGV